MNCIGSPSNLEILVHYYCTGKEPHPRLHAPAVKEGIEFLTQNGLFDRSDFPRVTDKGEFYLKHLLSIPFPEQYWKIPDERPETDSTYPFWPSAPLQGTDHP